MRITIAERLEAMEIAVSLVEGSKPKGSTALWEATKIMYGKILSHVDISEVVSHKDIGEKDDGGFLSGDIEEPKEQKPLGLSSDMFSGQS